MAKKSTVSIVTITQWKRFPCLEILKDMIKAQTYSSVIEWIIVEGSKLDEDIIENSKNIKEFIKLSDLNCPIIYLEKKPGEKLGGLRNKGNRACCGDITVVMDDDDFYPKERVEHAVKMLEGSDALIAGCSAMYIYDYTLNKLCKFKGFGPNHSINSCFAWKKKYLEKHSHDESKESGEEPSFTNGFKEKMIQLDPIKTTIQSSHSSNTYNKREIITGGIIKVNDTITEINEPISNFIPEPFFTRMANLFRKELVKSKYDIVYFAGGFCINWDPSALTLTGSEQAVVNLSSEWASQGKKVAVYGTVPTKQHNGVDYFDWKIFPFDEIHDTVILWRIHGFVCGAPFEIKTKNLWLDLHDSVHPKYFLETWYRYSAKINKLFFKSLYHKDLFEKTIRTKLDPDRCAIIPNGTRIKEFSENKDNVQRNPYRLCYTSCYTRGLYQLLKATWPIIKKIEPRAELHVYYGMDHITDENFKKEMTALLASPGVMDHGRQPLDIIVREKYMSNFHLYVTNTSEIDCISIKESLVAGAIPIISTSSIFKERDGIHIEIDDTNTMSYANLALKVLELMKGNLGSLRNNLKESKTLIGWHDISKIWLSHFNNLKPNIAMD